MLMFRMKTQMMKTQIAQIVVMLLVSCLLGLVAAIDALPSNMYYYYSPSAAAATSNTLTGQQQQQQQQQQSNYVRTQPTTTNNWAQVASPYQQQQSQPNSYQFTRLSSLNNQYQSHRPTNGGSLTRLARGSALSVNANKQNGGNAAYGGGKNKGNKIFELECLQVHNAYRAVHGAPPLKLDPKLTAFAQKRADYIAASDGSEFRHPNDLKYGENLAWHSRKTRSCKELIKMWYDEIELYDFEAGNFDHSTGHFTQLVWASTSRVGCAKSISEGPNGGVYLVCNYDPAGNYLGEARENVFRANTRLANKSSKPQPAPAASVTVRPPVNTQLLTTSLAPKVISTTTTTTTTKPTTTTTTTTTVAPKPPTSTSASDLGAATNKKKKNKKNKNNKNKKNKNRNKKNKNKKNKNKKNSTTTSAPSTTTTTTSTLASVIIRK